MNHKNRHTKFINTGRDPVTKNAAVKKEKGQADDSLKATTKMTSTGKPTFEKTVGHDNKPTPPEPLANARYYTKDGLRIPLYDSRGKRITHARDGRVILHKSNKKAVIDGVVASYAGEATAKIMENWTKNQIGDWITEVETKAYGNPPRAKTMKEKKEEKAARKQAASSARSPVENTGQRSRTSPDTTMETEEPQGRVTRSMSEEMKAMLEIDLEASHLDFSTPTSPTLEAPVSKAKSLVGRNPEAKIPLKDEAFSIVTSVNGDVHKKRKMTSPPAEPQQTPKKQKTDPPQLSSCTSPTMSQDPTRRDWYNWNPAHADLLAPRSTIHPSSTLISAFSLTPSWDANPSIFMSQAPPLRVLPLPGPQAHLLLLATTSARRQDATLYTLLLPHRDLTSQRKAAAQSKKIPAPHKRMRDAHNPLREPHLKPGHHGYDWANHRWGFAEDKDRKTGVGHQVEPADRQRLEDGEMSAEEFGQKYQGTRGRGALWPCGCEVWAEEGESEEE